MRIASETQMNKRVVSEERLFSSPVESLFPGNSITPFNGKVSRSKNSKKGLNLPDAQNRKQFCLINVSAGDDNARFLSFGKEFPR